MVEECNSRKVAQEVQNERFNILKKQVSELERIVAHKDQLPPIKK